MASNEAYQTDVTYAERDNPFGYEQELKKKFGLISMIGLAFVVLTTWTSMSSSMSIALPSGGPVAIIYGLLASGIGSLAVAASLAEMCSIYPTNGAQYEWAAVFAPPKHQRYISYIAGWIVTASWWALAATGPSLFSNLTIAFIELFNPDYVFNKWHEFLIYCSVEVCAGLINAFGTPAMPLLSKLFFYLSVSGFVAISIALVSLAKGRYQDAGFVFSGFINTTGWSDGTAWLLGLLQSCFSLTAFDAVAHLVEEMPRPRRDAPITMVIAVIMGTVTALLFVICILFSIQDVDGVITSSFGPIITIFWQVSGSKAGAVGMTLVILAIIWFSAAEVVTASARLTAAFARHNGLPFSSWLAKNNTKLDLPLNSMYLTNAMVILFGLIYLGTPTAFNAIVSSCVVGLNISYGIPIILLLLRGRSNLPQAHFSLGRFGYPINILSVLFLAITSVLFLFPSVANPSASEVNYAIVAIAVVIIIATIYWIFYGRKHYQQPKVALNDALPGLNPMKSDSIDDNARVDIQPGIDVGSKVEIAPAADEGYKH